jgi:hypothetical protein
MTPRRLMLTGVSKREVTTLLGLLERADSSHWPNLYCHCRGNLNFPFKFLKRADFREAELKTNNHVLRYSNTPISLPANRTNPLC